MLLQYIPVLLLLHIKKTMLQIISPRQVSGIKRPIFKNIAFMSSFVVTNKNFYFIYLKIIPVSITGIEATITDFTRSDIAAPSGLKGTVTIEPSSTFG